VTKEATITRVFDAPRERVWRAIVEPAELAAWFGHDPYTTHAEIDARPGGEFRAKMVSDEDGSEIPFFGHYREVEEPSRIVQTLEQPGEQDEVLTYTLREVDGGTELTYHQVGHMPDEQYPQVEQGVAGFFDRLAAHLARG
jgi:uncharacterized protein YndB with AHSA1/START domain